MLFAQPLKVLPITTSVYGAIHVTPLERRLSNQGSLRQEATSTSGCDASAGAPLRAVDGAGGLVRLLCDAISITREKLELSH